MNAAARGIVIILILMYITNATAQTRVDTFTFIFGTEEFLISEPETWFYHPAIPEEDNCIVRLKDTPNNENEYHPDYAVIDFNKLVVNSMTYYLRGEGQTISLGGDSGAVYTKGWHRYPQGHYEEKRWNGLSVKYFSNRFQRIINAYSYLLANFCGKHSRF